MAALLWKKLLIQTGLYRWLPASLATHAGVRWSGESAQFLPYYSDRVLSLPYEQLLQTRRCLAGQAPEIIDLAVGGPRLDLALSLSNRLPIDNRGYPPVEGLPELRHAVSTYLASAQHIDVDPYHEVLITHGAAGAFSAAVDAFVNPGDQVVLFDPTSPLYATILQARGARVRWLPLKTEDGRVRVRLERLAEALHYAKMIVFANPNNPTGGVFAPEDLEQIALWAEHRDVLIFHDTSFSRYSYGGQNSSELCEAGSPFSSAAKRTLVAGSLSKSHGLASVRVGWLAGHRYLIGACTAATALQSPFVAPVCQMLATQVLQTDPTHMDAVRDDFYSRRQYTYDRLVGMGLEPVWPAGGVYFWIPVRGLGVTGKQCAEQLWQNHQVLVWPGACFGPSGKHYIRLSYAAEEGRLLEGLRRVAEYVRGKQPRPAIAPPHHRLLRAATTHAETEIENANV